MVNCIQLVGGGCGNCVSYRDCGWCITTDSCANLSDDNFWKSECKNPAVTYCSSSENSWLEENYIWLSTVSTFICLISVCLCVCLCCRLGAAGRRSQPPISMIPPPPRDPNEPPTIEEMNATAVQQQMVGQQPPVVIYGQPNYYYFVPQQEQGPQQMLNPNYINAPVSPYPPQQQQQ